MKSKKKGGLKRALQASKLIETILKIVVLILDIIEHLG